jgi:tRNA U38,U39,U40 pseudouridine synthase TruA
MVGMIAQVGRGATTVDELRELLRTASSLPASVTAPPSGLFLEHVAYDDDDVPQELSPTIRI